MPANMHQKFQRLDDLQVAIVHPFLVSKGGGEKVIDALAELLPHAEIFTMMADSETFSPSVNRLPIHTTWLDRVPGRARLYQYLSPLYDAAVASHDLSGFDLVISSGGPGAKTATIPKSAVHVHYCHSPVRFLWDQYETWLGRLPATLRPLFAASVRSQRQRDLDGVSRVNAMIANSDFIGKRIARYYGCESETIYPPVDLAAAPPAERGGDYYLTVGRLVPNKRTELLIEACNALGRELVVVGAGPQEAQLARLAGPKVRIAGRVSSEELENLFVNARGYLFAAEEDFGIATVEAQSYGLPVIAYARGGSAEIVGNEETGILFDDQSAQGVIAAIEAFEAREDAFDRTVIQQAAQRFSKDRFMREMERALLEAANRGPSSGLGSTL